MGVLGQMFPGPKISDEAGESGTGEPPTFRLGPIDLESGTVTVLRSGDATSGDATSGDAAEGLTAEVGVDADGSADGDGGSD
jgi:hypothetical protein